MHLPLAAARKYVLVICMHLLAVISMHLLTVLYYVQVLFFDTKLRQLSLPDEDAVCMFESPRSPYLQDPLLFAMSFDLRPKTEIMTVLLHTFRCRSSLSVRWAVDHPGYFGKQCGMLLFLPSL